MFFCPQVLICRNYMGNMDMNEIDHFMPMLQKREEDAELAPMLSHGSSHFLWIKHSNLYRIRFQAPLFFPRQRTDFSVRRTMTIQTMAAVGDAQIYCVE